MLFPRPCRVLLLLAACGAAHAQMAHCVDSSSPGTCFSTIQAAVDVAQDGDVILIDTGTYGSFVVNDKELTILENDLATVSAGAVTVVNPNGKDVAIRGIDFVRTSPAVLGLGPERNLHVVDNTGTVWVEDCTFSTGEVALPFPGPTYPAVHVENSEALGGTLVLTRCVVEGADAIQLPVGTMQASVGILANEQDGDRLAVYDTVVEGGAGADGFAPFGLPGSDGADAIRLFDGYLVASGVTATGGDGGAGGLVPGCTDAGDGGDGVEITGFCVADVLGTSAAGGAGGTALGGCASGAPGVPVRSGPFATITFHATAVPHSVEVRAPVSDNSTITIDFSGEPFATVEPYWSADWGFALFPGAVIGPLLLDLLAYFPLPPPPALDSLGTSSKSYTLSSVVPPAAEAAVAFLQSLARGGSTVAGAPSILVVLK